MLITKDIADKLYDLGFDYNDWRDIKEVDKYPVVKAYIAALNIQELSDLFGAIDAIHLKKIITELLTFTNSNAMLKEIIELTDPILSQHFDRFKPTQEELYREFGRKHKTMAEFLGLHQTREMATMVK